MKANDHPRSILIGELSCRTGVPARLLRYYEEQDLLHPERDGSGYRSYREADAGRLTGREPGGGPGETVECRPPHAKLRPHGSEGRHSA